jgi:transposase
MPNERISMSKLRQLIRLQTSTLSVRELSRALTLSVGAVSKYLTAVRAAGLTAEAAERLSDAELEARVFGPAVPATPSRFAAIDFGWVHTELKRHRHVTLRLLWDEYRERVGEAAYGYSAFCDHYRAWAARLKRSMRQRHYAGEKLYVDYAGPKVPIHRASGEVAYHASVFVAALGASGYAFAEATRTQTLPDWLGSHVRALAYYGGAPAILVPDNPKVGVTKADRYEPVLQRSYEELASHYGAVVIPARPYRPKDKSKVEVTVQIVERWVLARLRNRRFFSLEELNVAIVPLLEELNARPFQRLPGSRASAFASLDRPALKALPATPYVYAEWAKVKVAFDYHVEVDAHWYSVPHALVGHEAMARYTAATVEVYHQSQRVATHVRSYQRGAHTTEPAHMPASHRAHASWTPRRLIEWARSIGPATGAVVEHLLVTKPHPEQGYRACLGLLALARRYGEARLEAASRLALVLHRPTRASVESILKTGRDQRPTPVGAASTDAAELPAHDNVRGPAYYH